MRFFKNVFVGLRAYAKAIRFMKQHKLYWFMLIPAALMLMIYAIGASVKNHHVATEAETVNDIIWLGIYLLAEISVALLLMKFSKYLVVAILSPLLAHLSCIAQRLSIRLAAKKPAAAPADGHTSEKIVRSTEHVSFS